MPRKSILSIIRIFFTLCVILPLNGQNFDRLNIPVYSGGKELKFPFTGGLRAGQFSNIDFNNDGKNDLFVFDRNGDQILPFVKTGAAGTIDFRFAPEYISIFPPVRNWALLRDFNTDGVMDVFTASGKYPGCIEVWRGSRDQSGRYTFRLITFNYGLPEILMFPISNNYTQIYVSSIDMPAIADVDGDGDLDIISFEADGSYASFYKNVSVEENLGLDSLKYIRQDICWGKFAENQFNETISLSSSGFSCSTGLTTTNTGLRHSGSSIAVFDNDGDGDMDIIIGDIGSSKLTRLFNGGSLANAHMTKLENNFPALDIPANLDYFLGVYYVDVDADGKRELIVTPNEINSAESENHVWLYKNVGTDSAPDFKFFKNNFLIDEMAYFNSASHPAFGDVNGDGLMDIIMGTGGIQLKNGVRKNRMVLLLNTGTTAQAKYNISDEDYLSFSKFGDQTGRFAPALGDIDQDGDEDLLIGDARGQLYLAFNTAGRGKPMTCGTPQYFFSEIFVGQNAKPQIIDLDNDGLKDLVIGEKNNELNFFKNIGTASSPKFKSEAEIMPNTRQAGKIHPGNDFPTQNGAPFFFKSGNKLHMIMGTEDAGFITYHEIEGNLYSGFKKLSDFTGNIKQGRKVTSSLADIDGDGYYEMAVGNERGGLVFYNTTFKVDTLSSLKQEILNDLKLNIFPNPAGDQVFILSDIDYPAIRLFNVSGKMVTELKINEVNDISLIPQGIYFIKADSKQGSLVKKLVVY
ncbi:MAG: T9SS type A sorting domain-containing protein [Saprospiraceae bacterium]